MATVATDLLSMILNCTHCVSGSESNLVKAERKVLEDVAVGFLRSPTIAVGGISVILKSL